MNADFYVLHHSFSTRYGKCIEVIHTLHGYSCADCGCGNSRAIEEPIPAEVQAVINAGICPHCGAEVRYKEFHWIGGYRLCRVDGCNEIGEPRHSLGLPAGHWCDHHYASSFPYRKDASGFDPAYAGERYDADY